MRDKSSWAYFFFFANKKCALVFSMQLLQSHVPYDVYIILVFIQCP